AGDLSEKASARPRLVAVPAPVEEPARAAAPQPLAARPVDGVWNVGELERLVRERGSQVASETREEWSLYVRYLRDFAASDGTLPATFDWLVSDVFASALEPVRLAS